MCVRFQGPNGQKGEPGETVKWSLCVTLTAVSTKRKHTSQNEKYKIEMLAIGTVSSHRHNTV